MEREKTGSDDQRKKTLDEALALHKQGKLEEAEQLYRNFLKEWKQDATALYLLGSLYYQLGLLKQAEDFLHKAIAVNTGHYMALNTLGLVYQAAEHPVEAQDAFTKALEIKPGYSSALNNLAILHQETGSAEDALSCFEKLLKTEGESPETFYNIGVTYQKMGNNEKARRYYAKSIEKNPRYAPSFNNLGFLAYSENKLQEAEEQLLKAVECKPDYAEAYFNLGNIYRDQKKQEKAKSIYQKVITLNNLFYEAFNNLGEIYFKEADYARAAAYFEKAVEIKTDYAEGYKNLGLCRHENGEFDAALASFDKAIKLNPNDPMFFIAKAEVLFTLERYEEGWEAYEKRLELEQFNNRRYNKPLWKGEPLKGKTIFIYEEQGIGDTIQFLRYLPLLKEQGADIIFECRKELLSLLNRQEYIDNLLVIGSEYSGAFDFDYHIPIMSIGAVLKSNLQTIPAPVPYITIDPTAEKAWEEFFKENTAFKIGIIWAGNPEPEVKKLVHFSVRWFERIAAIEGVELYSLQFGYGRKELEKDPGFEVTDLAGNIRDFTDTAAAMKQLDLIITADTVTAHLAGALGRPVWTLLRNIAEWRWRLKSEKTPWYPTMRLFRQVSPGNWQSVFEKVEQALNDKLHPTATAARSPLTLALSSGENFGWGVCSNYLKKEITKKMPAEIFDGAKETVRNVEGIVFHAMTSVDAKSLFNVRGSVNVGYTFFEYELKDEALKNSRQFDLVLGGSTWNYEKLTEKGIKPADVLIQGIDPDIFSPIDPKTDEEMFVIFSGGKFELRKGQDLVLKAVQILQQKYKDIVLINAWYNLFPQSMQGMAASKHISFTPGSGDWKELMHKVYVDNGIDPKRVITLPLVQNKQLPDLYEKTDIGLFPNRAEGGTNLVLMEYMASGRPVIASYNTGHKDVIGEGHSYPLEKMSSLQIKGENDRIIAFWEEPDLDEIIASIEYAYHNRDEIRETGKKAGEYMKKFTWEASADHLLNLLYEKYKF